MKYLELDWLSSMEKQKTDPMCEIITKNIK